jgi:hypothetical protein
MSPRNLSVLTRLSAVAFAFLAVGAAPKRKAAPLKSGPGISTPETCQTFRAPQAGNQDDVEVTFLGVGGFLIRWAGQSVMTPPLYSNPTIGEVALSELYPDGERIDRLLHYPVKDLKAIIVGHAHHDHAMDIPYIALKKSPDAGIYGSKTLVAILDPLVEPPLDGRNPLVEVESKALCRIENPLVDPCPAGSNPCAAGPVKIPGRRFQIWPIASEHSAPFGPKLVKSVTPWWAKLLPLPVKIDPVVGWRGQLLAPATALPTRTGDWTSGTVLSYVIEMLDDLEAPVFRIYYQDSPTRMPIGYPPPCIGKIDLALLCIGGASEKPIRDDFPGDIVQAIKPQYVIGAHWEDLFNPRVLPLPRKPGITHVDETIRPAPGARPKQFIKDVYKALETGGRVTVPCWEDVAYFVREGGGWILDMRLGSRTVGSWSTPKP